MLEDLKEVFINRYNEYKRILPIPAPPVPEAFSMKEDLKSRIHELELFINFLDYNCPFELTFDDRWLISRKLNKPEYKADPRAGEKIRLFYKAVNYKDWRVEKIMKINNPMPRLAEIKDIIRVCEKHTIGPIEDNYKPPEKTSWLKKLWSYLWS